MQRNCICLVVHEVLNCRLELCVCLSESLPELYRSGLFGCVKRACSAVLCRIRKLDPELSSNFDFSFTTSFAASFLSEYVSFNCLKRRAVDLNKLPDLVIFQHVIRELLHRRVIVLISRLGYKSVLIRNTGRLNRLRRCETTFTGAAASASASAAGITRPVKFLFILLLL